MFILISLPAAIIPAWLLMRYFINSDRFPEPEAIIRKTFLYGVAIVIPVLLFALPISVFENSPVIKSSAFNAAVFSAFVTAAIPEEFFKFIVLKYYCAKQKEFDEPMDGIVYGVVASLGFATLENILYVINGGLGVAIMRAFTAVPAHAAFGAIMGYYFSKTHFQSKKVSFLSMALIFPTILHGLYDFFLFYMQGTAARSSSTEGLTTGEALTILTSFGLFFVTLIYCLVKAYRSLKEYQKEQDMTA